MDRKQPIDDAQAIEIISSLANGVDPRTGEMFSADSPYQSGDVIRALYMSVRALEICSRARARKSAARKPANAGKPWSDDEDRKLLEEFDKGLSMTELANAHDRSLASIQARLERHGRVHAQRLAMNLRGRSGNTLASSDRPHEERSTA